MTRLSIGWPGRQPARQAVRRPRLAAQDRDDALVVVDARAEAAALVVGVEALAIDLVLLRRERHPVGEALGHGLRLVAVPLEPADRGAVADQLVVVELRPPEPRPPLGPLVALVVVDQVREQPSRLALLGSVEQPRLQCLPFGVELLGLLGRLPLVGRQAPGDLGAAGSSAATRAARRSSGSPPRCSARRPRGSSRRRSRPTPRTARPTRRRRTRQRCARSRRASRSP